MNQLLFNMLKVLMSNHFRLDLEVIKQELVSNRVELTKQFEGRLFLLFKLKAILAVISIKQIIFNLIRYYDNQARSR